jgi:DNA-directed RNA polymerase specialized sigma24 family protein
VNSAEVLAARFEEDRHYLRAVAYRLIGSLGDADDVVQQTWLKIGQADLPDVENLAGWLTTVTARQCIELLRARRRRDEVTLAGDEHGSAPGLPRRGPQLRQHHHCRSEPEGLMRAAGRISHRPPEVGLRSLFNVDHGVVSV